VVYDRDKYLLINKKDMKETLNQIFYGNTVLHYLVVFGSMLLLWIVWRLIKKWLIRFVVSLTAKTQSNIDNLLVDAARNFILPYVYLFFQYRIFQQLNLSPEIEKILSVAAMLVTTYFVVRLIIYSTQHLITETMKARNEPEQRIKQVVACCWCLKCWFGGAAWLCWWITWVTMLLPSSLAWAWAVLPLPWRRRIF